MSLVPTYVKATDNYFYKDPTLEGKDWFICFDDDDPPELVIAVKAKLNPETLLNTLGIKYSNLRKGHVAGRVFGKNWHFKTAQSYFFELQNKLDPKLITTHEGKVKTITGDCVFYDPDL